jgi:hypothetical protein
MADSTIKNPSVFAESDKILVECALDAIPNPTLRTLDFTEDFEIKATKALKSEVRLAKRKLYISIIFLRFDLLVSQTRHLLLEAICNLGNLACHALRRIAHPNLPDDIGVINKRSNEESSHSKSTDN